MKKSIILFGGPNTGKSTYCKEKSKKYLNSGLLNWNSNFLELKAYLTNPVVIPDNVKLITLEGVTTIRKILQFNNFFYRSDTTKFEHIKLIITSNSICPDEIRDKFHILKDNFRVVNTNLNEEWNYVSELQSINKVPFKLKSKVSKKNKDAKYDRFMIALQKASILYNKALVDTQLSKDLFSVFESGEVDKIKAFSFQNKYPELFNLN